VIATTNRPLRELLDEGKFRLDLYYRLNVIPLAILPLRERREDIPELAEFFVRKYAGRSGQSGQQLSRELLARLQDHDWPGNIRELENFVRRALALSEEAVIGTEVLAGLRLNTPSRGKSTLEPGLTFQQAEKQLLERTLEATGGNRTRAAEMLGISIRTIRNKIREYGLPPREMA
jgi:DNA-binding NtrC family response regulator